MFDKGDKIVCIKNYDANYMSALTIWKQYEVFDVRYDGAVYIKDDKGAHSLYSPERFISIQEAREQKLNKIIK
jgi:hypothetical protein